MTSTDALYYAIAIALRPTPAQAWLTSLTIPEVTPDGRQHPTLAQDPAHEHA